MLSKGQEEPLPSNLMAKKERMLEHKPQNLGLHEVNTSLSSFCLLLREQHEAVTASGS